MLKNMIRRLINDSINISGGQYIGNIIEPPHEIGTIADHSAISNGQDISQDITEALGGGADITDDGDDSLSLFEIWKHLAGFQD